PRFFVPEHGTMFTLALVRFPPTATKEIQYLNAKGALTYTDIAGDPVLYGNLPPREISMKDVFRSGDSSKKFKIAEGQWYRDRKSGSAGMPRPISYAVFCLKKKKKKAGGRPAGRLLRHVRDRRGHPDALRQTTGGVRETDPRSADCLVSTQLHLLLT